MAEDLNFPKWKPQYRTWDSADNSAKIYKAIKHSSASFISKQDVRSFIFSRDKYKCSICGKSERLQIDHIVSIHACSMGIIPIDLLNLESNLQTLCSGCNAAKKP